MGYYISTFRSGARPTALDAEDDSHVHLRPRRQRSMAQASCGGLKLKLIEVSQ